MSQLLLYVCHVINLFLLLTFNILVFHSFDNFVKLSIEMFSVELSWHRRLFFLLQFGSCFYSFDYFYRVGCVSIILASLRDMFFLRFELTFTWDLLIVKIEVIFLLIKAFNSPHDFIDVILLSLSVFLPDHKLSFNCPLCQQVIVCIFKFNELNLLPLWT